MRRLSIAFCVLGLLASPTLAAWVGNVTDVAPANTVVNQTTTLTYASIVDAYAVAGNGDTLLIGPGEWNCDAFGDSVVWLPYMVQDGRYVSMVGSGSGSDPNTNSIFNGYYDTNETPGDPNTYGGRRNFMSVFGSHGSAGSPMQLKDFRVTGFGESGIMFGGFDHVQECYDPNYGTDPNIPLTAGVNKPTDPNTGYVEIDNLYFHIAEDGLPGQHEWGTAGHDGAGEAIEAWMGDLSNVVVRNSMFAGKNAYGMRIAQQSSIGYHKAADWLIEGNTFTNMKNGIVLNAGDVDRWQIINNEFTNMTEFVRADEWNTYGNSGIVLAPRGTVSTPGSIEGVLIKDNYFADNGYVPTEPNDPDPNAHPWAGLDLLGECGIQAQVYTYGAIRDLMIRDNTFAETAAGGVMKSGIALKVTDYSNRNITYTTTTATPGDLEHVSLKDNTFIGMTEEDVEGTTAGWVGNPNPVIYPVKLVAGTTTPGCTKSGDSDADDDIDVADIDAMAAGPARLDLITKGLDTSLADTNLDYQVNLSDLGNLANKYKQAGPMSFADGDTDGLADTSGFFVNLADLGNLANDYKKFFDRVPGADPYAGTYSPPIPEPATLTLLALAGAGLLRRRR